MTVEPDKRTEARLLAVSVIITALALFGAAVKAGWFG